METITKEVNQSQQQNEVSKPKITKVKFGAFGDGRYSPAMGELYRDTQRLLGFTKAQAHVTATRLGVDCGALNASQVTVQFGKTMNKEGFRTLKEITKGVKVPNSWALSLGATCRILDEAREQGALIGGKNATVEVAPKLMEFVDKYAATVESIDEKAS